MSHTALRRFVIQIEEGVAAREDVQVLQCLINTGNVHNRLLVKVTGVVEIPVRPFESLEIRFHFRVPGTADANRSDAEFAAPGDQVLLGLFEAAWLFPRLKSPVMRMSDYCRPRTSKFQWPRCSVFRKQLQLVRSGND